MKESLEKAGIRFDLSGLDKQENRLQTLCLNQKTDTVQILGHRAIETSINALLLKRSSMDKQSFDMGTLSFAETLEILNSNTIELDSEQLKALSNAFVKPVSFIAGKAGTGKSLISQVIVDVCINNGLNVWRITSSSSITDNGLPNLKGDSIYHFISKAKKIIQKSALAGSMIVVEGANSIDILTLYKLLQVLPIDTHICFIGDKYKLPPIGPGTFFKQAVELMSDAVIELIESNYHASNSNMNQVTHSLIDNSAPPLFEAIPDFDLSSDQSLSIYHSTENAQDILSNITANIWSDLASISNELPKIICTNTLLCDDINILIQQLSFDRKKVAKIVVKDRIFYEGEPIVFAKTNSFINVAVGTLGAVTRIYEKPVIAYGKECWISIRVAGNEIDLSLEDIDSIALAYAITAQRIQGYKFSYTLIVLDNFYFVNKAWLYTCISASSDSTLFVGNKYFLLNKVDATDFSVKRHHGIPLVLEVSDE
jgi:ATP-dependent exoDNAse (exonuclease V) alpha subunit